MVNKMNTILQDRQEAGSRLASKLTAYFNHPQAIVLGLPRGGVPVAHEVARILNLPLDVCLVKKLGLPWKREVAVGVVAEDSLLPNYTGNITIIDEKKPQLYGLDGETLKAIAATAKAELQWRDRTYRHYRPMLPISERIVIVVDDGIATGLTMRAVVKILHQHQPQKIIIVAPIASRDAIEQLRSDVDEIICLVTPQFGAISLWYRDYCQISDRVVCDLLSQETQIVSNNRSDIEYEDSSKYATPTAKSFENVKIKHQKQNDKVQSLLAR